MGKLKRAPFAMLETPAEHYMIERHLHHPVPSSGNQVEHPDAQSGVGSDDGGHTLKSPPVEMSFSKESNLHRSK